MCVKLATLGTQLKEFPQFIKCICLEKVKCVHVWTEQNCIVPVWFFPTVYKKSHKSTPISNKKMYVRTNST